MRNYCKVFILFFHLYFFQIQNIFGQNRVGVNINYLCNLEIESLVTYDALAINGHFSIKKLSIQSGLLFCRAVPKSKIKVNYGGDLRLFYDFISKGRFKTNINYSVLYLIHDLKRNRDTLKKRILHSNIGMGITFNASQGDLLISFNTSYSIARYWFDNYSGNGVYSSLFLDLALT